MFTYFSEKDVHAFGPWMRLSRHDERVLACIVAQNVESFDKTANGNEQTDVGAACNICLYLANQICGFSVLITKTVNDDYLIT